MAFEGLIGNESNKELLINIANSQHILHSYQFVGESGIGKFQFAKEFSKILLCQNEKEKPCNKCKSCIDIQNHNHPDFYCIEPEGNSIKVNTIREVIHKMIEKPIFADRKIYIINDSDLMTVEAQNTLLKTLEEPVDYVTMILIIQNENTILNTIKSRCMKINFKPIEDKILKEYLGNKYKMENISEHFIKASQGSIEKSIHIEENKEIYEKIENIFSKIEQTQKVNIISNENPIYQSKDIIMNILDYINIIFLDKMKKEKALPYINSIEIVNHTKVKLNGNSNFDMTIDNMLLKIWEEIFEK